MQTTETKINLHSAENQRIIRKLVQRDVYLSLSTLIYELAGIEKFRDELLEIQAQDDYRTAALKSEAWSVLDAKKQSEIVENDGFQEFCETNSIEPYQIEALEHWAVSKWLGEQLRNQGEMVAFGFLGFEAIWGRGCSGQAILLDDVICDIAESMEILSGQANEWKI